MKIKKGDTVCYYPLRGSNNCTYGHRVLEVVNNQYLFAGRPMFRIERVKGLVFENEVKKEVKGRVK